MFCLFWVVWGLSGSVILVLDRDICFGLLDVNCVCGFGCRFGGVFEYSFIFMFVVWWLGFVC